MVTNHVSKQGSGRGKSDEKVSVVRAGSVTLKIYTLRHGNRVRYTVSWHVGPKRHRKHFSCLQRARAFAKERAEALAAGQVHGPQLTTAQAQDTKEALRRLGAVEMPLHVVAGEYVDLKRTIGERGTLRQAVEFYLHNSIRPDMERTVSQVVEEFTASRRAGGVRVPDDVAVIGVDNDPLICELSYPPLSSIEQGAREVGYRAAKWLHGLMSTRARRPRQFVVEPVGVIARASTESLAVDDADAARALQIIRRAACEGLTPEEVCRQVGRSRSGLEARFRECFHSTLAAKIMDIRFDRAHEQVLHTRAPLKSVADQCGFSSVQHMTSFFHKRLGHTPAEIRKNYHPEAKH